MQLGLSLQGNTTEKEKPQKVSVENYINRIEVLQQDEMLVQIVKQF